MRPALRDLQAALTQVRPTEDASTVTIYGTSPRSSTLVFQGLGYALKGDRNGATEVADAAVD